MPDTSSTPTHREVLIIGRAGGGRDGAPGGVAFYDHGSEVRLDPGDIADVPVKIAKALINDGLAEATGDFDSEPDADEEPVERDPTLVDRVNTLLFGATEESD